MQFGDVKVGPRLYIRRVLIMDHCEALLPPYLRFVKGVVDCADLPLNISREMLQHNPQLERIQKNIVKNVLKALEEMKNSAYDAYLALFKELGGILKEGLSRDWANREQISDLLLFESLKTAPGIYTTLAAYVEQMPAEQKDICYLAGESRDALTNAPYLEVFRHRGWNVLFLTDPIDEFVFPTLGEYKGKKLKAADRGEVEPQPEEQKKFSEVKDRFQPLFDVMKSQFSDVSEIRLSKRLKESASCLVSDEAALGANMERLLQKLGRLEGSDHAKRILELNPEHPAVEALIKTYERNRSDPRIATYGRLLYDQAVIAEGSRLKDPQEFARLVNELLVKDANAE
jgi:molecular chaperone HtpG